MTFDVARRLARPGRLWTTTVVALVMTVVVAARADDAVAPPAQDPAAAAKRDAEVLGWLLKRAIREVVPMNVPQAIQVPVEVNQQLRQQVDQQAQQLERMLDPVLASELEMIRQSCSDLEPAARTPILTAGRTALKQAARGMAERQLNGRLGQDDFDPRLEIRRSLVAALEKTGPMRLATYQREQDDRAARQARAARLRIVAKLDGQLDLSAAQRKAIEADLERLWDASWVRALAESGLINDQPIAPDFAAAAIVPHLADAQQAAWKAWCQTSGSGLVGRRFISWNFDGQGLQGHDTWWGP
jgi:hypothetical protein